MKASADLLSSRTFFSIIAGVVLAAAGLGCSGPDIDDPDGSESGWTSPTLVLMGTTDVHGQLLPWDYEADGEAEHGLSRLLPIVDSIRSVNAGPTLLVDSGDLLQGNPLSAAFTPLGPDEEHPVITAMNLMGYDAAALGNHEFNFGIEHLDRSIAAADFPFLSANVVDAETGEAAYPEYVILERELEGRPLRIGVTAVLPPGVAVWDRDHVEGRLDFPDIVDALRSVVPRMRGEGADVVVVAAHNAFEGTSYDTVSTGLGAENRMADVARMIQGIDVVFLGHSHREVADSTLNGTLFLQAGPRAASLAVATVELAFTEAEGWRVERARGELIRPDPGRSDERMEAALADAHARAVSQMTRVIATSPEAWSAAETRVRPTPLMELIHEVQREVTGADLSAVASFSLSAGLPRGDITVAHIARLYPYDNNLLRAVRITGAELKEYLEHSARYFNPCPEAQCDPLVNPDWPGFNFDMVSGVEYTLDPTRPIGERVTRLEREGRPVADTDEFTLALNNYRQGGGGAFPAVTQAEVVYEGNESVRELLIRAIEARGTLDPADFEATNWEIHPPELVDQALREGGGR